MEVLVARAGAGDSAEPAETAERVHGVLYSFLARTPEGPVAVAAAVAVAVAAEAPAGGQSPLCSQAEPPGLDPGRICNPDRRVSAGKAAACRPVTRCA